MLKMWINLRAEMHASQIDCGRTDYSQVFSKRPVLHGEHCTNPHKIGDYAYAEIQSQRLKNN